MATPRIANTPYYKLNIPELSGGINTRDGFSHIQDNQLTDTENLWYRNGLLKTRPAMSWCKNPINSAGAELNSKVDFVTSNYEIYANKKNTRIFDGKTYFLVAIKCAVPDKKLIFRYYSSMPNTETDIGKYTYKEVATIPADNLPKNVKFTCNVFQHDTDIYCFCSGYYETEDIPYYIFKITETDGKFSCKRIKDDDFYVPTVAVNCGTNGFGNGYDGGTMFEGYNLLSNRYKLYYSTVNKSLISEDGTVLMQYSVPFKIYDLYKKEDLLADGGAEDFLNAFSIKITDKKSGKIVTHRLDGLSGPGGYGFIENKFNNNDALKMKVNITQTTLEVYFLKQGDGDSPEDYQGRVHKLTAEDFLYNNMEITLPCATTKENYEKVLNMTCNEWYGGSSEGIYGGMHLFLGGNTNEKEKALVVWSDLEKPLYFSENSYAYVGDKSQRVTALGRQGESLIIFKEREIYATQYTNSSTNIDAEALESQAVVDITAAEVIFPMVQVHGFIGCDCPNTVQMCRNRLVWLHSDGKVYTLSNASQYNERSVLEVSGMISKKLKSLLPNSYIFAEDWNGYYVLSIGDYFFLMDYNSYGYANVSSYLKNDDAQLRIPWWVWKKPQVSPTSFADVRSLVNIGDKLFAWVMIPTYQNGTYYGRLPELFCFDDSENATNPCDYFTIYDFGTNVRTENYKNIPTVLQTKFFDFGAPSIKKNVPKVELTFGANGGTPIKASIITDMGTDEETIVIDQPETDIESPANFNSYLIRPRNRINHRIGFRLESEGDMSVDALSLQYKLIGGLR